MGVLSLVPQSYDPEAHDAFMRSLQGHEDEDEGTLPPPPPLRPVARDGDRKDEGGSEVWEVKQEAMEEGNGMEMEGLVEHGAG